MLKKNQQYFSLVPIRLTALQPLGAKQPFTVSAVGGAVCTAVKSSPCPCRWDRWRHLWAGRLSSRTGLPTCPWWVGRSGWGPARRCRQAGRRSSNPPPRRADPHALGSRDWICRSATLTKEEKKWRSRKVNSSSIKYMNQQWQYWTWLHWPLSACRGSQAPHCCLTWLVSAAPFWQERHGGWMHLFLPTTREEKKKTRVKRLRQIKATNAEFRNTNLPRILFSGAVSHTCLLVNCWS